MSKWPIINTPFQILLEPLFHWMLLWVVHIILNLILVYLSQCMFLHECLFEGIRSSLIPNTESCSHILYGPIPFRVLHVPSISLINIYTWMSIVHFYILRRWFPTAHLFFSFWGLHILWNIDIRLLHQSLILLIKSHSFLILTILGLFFLFNRLFRLSFIFNFSFLPFRFLFWSILNFLSNNWESFMRSLSLSIINLTDRIIIPKGNTGMVFLVIPLSSA